MSEFSMTYVIGLIVSWAGAFVAGLAVGLAMRRR